MPLYKNIGRGPLKMSRTVSIPPGESVEMSEADAKSLPPGIVEPVKSEKKPEPKLEQKKGA